jgi:predicted DNA-binding protein
LTIDDYAMIVTDMVPRKLQLQSLYLEPKKAELLDSLAGETRIPKAVLLREAVDDLLIKHKKLRKAKDTGGRGS